MREAAELAAAEPVRHQLASLATTISTIGSRFQSRSRSDPTHSFHRIKTAPLRNPIESQDRCGDETTQVLEIQGVHGVGRLVVVRIPEIGGIRN